MPPNPPESSDQTLLRAAARGDPIAFESLYLRHRDFVLRIAHRHARTHDDALDAAQDTFIHLLHAIPTLRLTGQLRTYLYPIAKNAALARARQDSRRTEILRLKLAPSREPAAAHPPSSPAPEDAPLTAALETLSDDLREVLLMRVVDELSIEEVAQALSIPQGTVKSRLHAALNKLRENSALRALFNEHEPLA